jgi:hypothetical protein
MDRDPVMYWNFSGTAQAFPSNGVGGQSVLRVGGTSTAAATVYTPTTVTDSTPWTPAAVARGDYVVTTGGFWGIVQSTAAGPPIVVTVDYWRLPGARDKQLPLDGTACSVFAKNINAGCGVLGVRLMALRITTGVTGNIAITDHKGTALMTIATTNGEEATHDWSGQNMVFPHPIGLISSVANVGTLEFVCN